LSESDGCRRQKTGKNNFDDRQGHQVLGRQKLIFTWNRETAPFLVFASVTCSIFVFFDFYERLFKR